MIPNPMILSLREAQVLSSTSTAALQEAWVVASPCCAYHGKIFISNRNAALKENDRKTLAANPLSKIQGNLPKKGVVSVPWCIFWILTPLLRGTPMLNSHSP